MRPLVALLCLALAAQARAAPPTAAAPSSVATQEAVQSQSGQSEALPTTALPLRARLDRDAIRAAIAGLQEEADPYPRRHEADTLSATPYQAFSQDFARARLPDCLHSEGLKNQPTFFLSGVLALPFIGVAKLRGVCR